MSPNAEGENPRLNDRQKQFIAAYCDCLNATEAARRAGYSDRTARQMGTENLSKPSIRAEVDRLLTERAMGKGEVLARLTAQARASVKGFYRKQDSSGYYVFDLQTGIENGTIDHVKDITPLPSGGVAIKMRDTESALDKLAKAYGLYQQQDKKADPFDDNGSSETEDSSSSDSITDAELLTEADLARS